MVSWVTLPALIFQSLTYSNVVAGTTIVACVATFLHGVICAAASGCAPGAHVSTRGRVCVEMLGAVYLTVLTAWMLYVLLP